MSEDSQRPNSISIKSYIDENGIFTTDWLPFKNFKTMVLIFPDGTTKELSAEEFNKQFKRRDQ